jgi:oxygen-independent coproporphyrinogen III oxidase
VSLGLYISVPFCRNKCSYCNFASGVFPQAVFRRYVDRVCADLERAPAIAREVGGRFEKAVSSVYLGGGTPTILEIKELERILVTIAQNFAVERGAEITVECAPGTLAPPIIEGLRGCGVNRVSLGVQSFVDQEARSVGRSHTRAATLEEIDRLRAAGISNINVDLIAGLPYQTAESWGISLDEVLALEAPHVSVYMLEIDEDSRLGRELIAGGTRYHAHFVPDEDLTAALYERACERLEAAGIRQYEISNFAREGCESAHNLKYWRRQPYLGVGVDAHSMLAAFPAGTAVRFATEDSLEDYLADAPLKRTQVSLEGALEETFFLGLRLTEGVDLEEVAARFGQDAVAGLSPTVNDMASWGLMERTGSRVKLTGRGRLLSNEVFERFVSVSEPR